MRNIWLMLLKIKLKILILSSMASSSRLSGSKRSTASVIRARTTTCRVASWTYGSKCSWNRRMSWPALWDWFWSISFRKSETSERNSAWTNTLLIHLKTARPSNRFQGGVSLRPFHIRFNPSLRKCLRWSLPVLKLTPTSQYQIKTVKISYKSRS